jgi:hypothetical protein
MVIIGLGSAGINIANKFKKWPQYKVILPPLDAYGTVEEQEENTPDFSDLFENIEGEVWFIVCGMSKKAASSLRILEKIKHCKIKILYIQPDLELVSEMARKRERVVYKVLQEYTRSGLLDSMYIISNSAMSEIVGHGSIVNYYNNMNDAISSVVHYYNIYRNTDPVFGQTHKTKEISRIRTFGIYDLEKNEEKLFFSLDNTTETCYIYNITKDELENNHDLLPRIKGRAKERVSDNIITSFSIFSTDFEESFCHVVAYTHFIQ